MTPDLTERAASGGLVYGRDLKVGGVYQLGSHLVSEPDLIAFASDWDPQYFHVDPQAAQSSPYGGLIASGLHTLAIYQRLMVTHVSTDWAVIAGRGLDGVRFLRPVRPGDTLTGSATISDLLEDDRNRTLVSIAADLRNADGKS
ncbi:MaoC/PaaZ C-terminal domain-containing protein, partial [Gordonia sp. (in: high G+C Gram-positive bacteria)]